MSSIHWPQAGCVPPLAAGCPLLLAPYPRHGPTEAAKGNMQRGGARRGAGGRSRLPHTPALLWLSSPGPRAGVSWGDPGPIPWLCANVPLQPAAPCLLPPGRAQPRDPCPAKHLWPRHQLRPILAGPGTCQLAAKAMCYPKLGWLLGGLEEPGAAGRRSGSRGGRAGGWQGPTESAQGCRRGSAGLWQSLGFLHRGWARAVLPARREPSQPAPPWAAAPPSLALDPPAFLGSSIAALRAPPSPAGRPIRVGADGPAPPAPQAPRGCRRS